MFAVEHRPVSGTAGQGEHVGGCCSMLFSSSQAQNQWHCMLCMSRSYVPPGQIRRLGFGHLCSKPAIWRTLSTC